MRESHVTLQMSHHVPISVTCPLRVLLNAIITVQHKAQLLTVKRHLDGNGTKFDAEKLEQSPYCNSTRHNHTFLIL